MKRKTIISLIMVLFLSVGLNAQKISSFTLDASADDLKLDVVCVSPSEGVETKGVLQMIHGMCEHKERYLPFMTYMAQNGYVCVMHDHRGHGASVKSSDDLGYFYEGGYSAMIDDVKEVTEWIKNEYPEQEISMFGHSMGSMVVRAYAKRYDQEIERLIVCGTPSYDRNSKLGAKIAQNSIKHKGGHHRPKMIQKLSFNSFNKKFKNEGSANAWICSDKAVVAAYDADPLCSYQFTSNGFYNLFSLMQYTYDEDNWQMNNSTMPVMFISGENDPCLVNEKKFNKAVQTMRNVGYQNVTSRLYPGMRHEILNEIDKATVWKDILDFIQQNK